MPQQAEAVIKQIDGAIANSQALRSRSKYADCSDQLPSEITDVITRLSVTIERFAPPGSRYVKTMNEVLEDIGPGNGHSIEQLVGVLKALRTAYEGGYLATVVELIHADVFSDFLEMADHLLSEGFKDPAAVVVGSVLEEHLRQTCLKRGLSLLSGTKPKKADAMNSELASVSAYSKLDQKSVTAWLDLRNRAAHGKYYEYTKDQVCLMLQGVRDFMVRVPA
jgi:hypothetical protein